MKLVNDKTCESNPTALSHVAESARKDSELVFVNEVVR